MTFSGATDFSRPFFGGMSGFDLQKSAIIFRGHDGLFQLSELASTPQSPAPYTLEKGHPTWESIPPVQDEKHIRA
jgi:hypothetical protein